MLPCLPWYSITNFATILKTIDKHVIVLKIVKLLTKTTSVNLIYS